MYRSGLNRDFLYCLWILLGTTWNCCAARCDSVAAQILKSPISLPRYFKGRNSSLLMTPIVCLQALSRRVFFLGRPLTSICLMQLLLLKVHFYDKLPIVLQVCKKCASKTCPAIALAGNVVTLTSSWCSRATLWFCCACLLPLTSWRLKKIVSVCFWKKTEQKNVHKWEAKLK